MPYVGECKQCGWCCRNLGAFYETNAIRDEFMIARGWKRLQVSKDGKVTMWILKHACPSLTADNKCLKHNSKPVACKVYPHSLELEKIGMDPQASMGRHCGFRWRNK